MHRRFVLRALIVAAVALPALIVGTSQARSHPRIGTEVLHLAFIRDGLADDGFLLSGPYAYALDEDGQLWRARTPPG